jgi:uncharacterized protein YqgC (DUF456 family)
MDGQVLWQILAVLLVLTGMAGLVLPALPGAAFIIGGLFLSAWAEGFTHVGAVSLGLITLLGAFTFVVDLVAGSLGAKGFGASPRAALGAAIGSLAVFVIGPLGIVLGPFAGAVIGEISAQRSLGAAGMAGLGATIGLVLGVAVKLALAGAMIGVFLFARFVA